MNEREIFLSAVGKTDAAQRASYLDEACGGDAELRRRLEVLLSAHAQAQEFLEAPASGIAATIDRQALEQVGAQIGPYKLLQKLGEGGFGAVYMAEQEKPVRRMVALKIIKPGMDTREVIARFESERQALAIMEHPNIAKVLDAGATETGRPYFVMELVKGVPITEFCDRNHMPAQQRLSLFVTACQAIQHAHHKGVIHRDIKPSNVMVTLHDGVPVVKVIDFGVAKATSQKLTEKTLFTAYGQMIGTPAYMSPEQAEMSGLDIDTRSDIYSLGVLLYELLTGTTPLDLKRLRSAGYAEMQRLIREEEAPRPSTRMSSLGGEASVLAVNRGTDPRRLAQLLSGDLDWIVMKALEKDRNRRYASPGSFAEDIERYLHQDAILARPPSTLYRLKKYAQRNRVAVFLMLFVPATVLAVLINHIAGLYRIRAQRDRAVAAERLASERLTQVEKADGETKQALKQSEEARQQAEAERNRAVEAEKVAQANEQKARGEEQKARDMTVDMINLLASFQNHVADVTTAYKSDGKLDEAVGFYEEAAKKLAATLGPTQNSTYVGLANLSMVYQAAGKTDEAIKLFEQSIPVLKSEVLGPGKSHPITLFAMSRLAGIYSDIRQPERAIPLLEHTVPAWRGILGPTDDYTLMLTNNLGAAYLMAGQPEKAVPILEEVFKVRESKIGRDHPHTLISMKNLAAAYRDAGRLDEAIGLYEEIVELSTARFGADHIDTVQAMRPLGQAYQTAGRLDESIAHRLKLLPLMQEKFGADHQETLLLMYNLSTALHAAGRLSDPEAISFGQERLRVVKAKLGPDDVATANAMMYLAWGYRDADRIAESIPLWEEMYRIRKAKLGAEDINTINVMRNLARGYEQARRLAEAVAMGEQIVPLLKSKLGAENEETVAFLNNLAKWKLELEASGKASAK